MSSLSDALRQMRLPDGFNQGLLSAAAEALDCSETARAKDHKNTLHMIQTLRDTFREEKATWDAERAKHQKELGEIIDERDEYHEMADRLAQAIADHLLVSIGEHSSANCPWMRALEEIQNHNCQTTYTVAQQDAPTGAEIIATLERHTKRDRYPDGTVLVDYLGAMRELLARYAPAQDAEQARDASLPEKWNPAESDEMPRVEFASLVVQEACETEPADADDTETIRIRRDDLRSAVLAAFQRHDAARAGKGE